MLLVPAGVPPHKEVEADPGVEHRVAMCEAAVAGDERLGVSRADVDRAGPAYTVELLRALHAAAPGGRADVHRRRRHGRTRCPTWREPEAVLALARLARRRARGRARAPTSPSGSPGCAASRERVEFFDMPRLDISSSLLRRRAAAGLPLRYLVPDAVAAYIAREGLYAAARRAAGRRAAAYP